MTHLGLFQRKHLSSSESHLLENCVLEDPEDPSGVRLTLTEQVFLLGLKDREGYVSFWNDYISRGLRGCILIDLFLRGRIRLVDRAGRAKSVLTRKVVLTNDVPTDDPLLDEVLKWIKLSQEPHTVPEWIDYMSSENWFQLKYRLRNVQNRIAKALVEKGVLKTSIQNFYLFSITTHPLLENVTKAKIVTSLQNAILKKWSYDAIRMDKKLLALIFLAHASGVLDNALESLGNEDYRICKTRIVNLLRLDFERQAYKSDEDALMWAVIYALAKNDYI
ncbi:Golgi phosphoprotein 3 homolog sauron-like [Photinus pyralis]|uniref:Golgi phosphoprotein 3 n=1 Tax=Photinus pyralis TaxID=7054 RepID=A0A1Y1KBB9_PHOPY|nr:Golgi phosphoprotein 3 homolog sauron-like [Photinus pyralis]